jgi:hypothetical protein
LPSPSLGHLVGAVEHRPVQFALAADCLPSAWALPSLRLDESFHAVMLDHPLFPSFIAQWWQNALAAIIGTTR